MATERELKARIKALEEIEKRTKSTQAAYSGAESGMIKVADAAKEAAKVQKQLSDLGDDYNKALKSGIDLSKKFSKSKKDDNIRAAKLLGINNDIQRQALKDFRVRALSLEKSEGSVNLAEVLNTIAQQEQQVRDNISDGLDEEITQRDIISAIGEENLNKAKEFLETQKDLEGIDLDGLVKSTSKFSKES